jgi:cyclophilin family peptidyl-prolyl cis-trans isomerase
MNHTIFGEVTEGMDVVEKLEGVKKGSGDRPVEDQKIISATVFE